MIQALKLLNYNYLIWRKDRYVGLIVVSISVKELAHFLFFQPMGLQEYSFMTLFHLNPLRFVFLHGIALLELEVWSFFSSNLGFATKTVG